MRDSDFAKHLYAEQYEIILDLSNKMLEGDCIQQARGKLWHGIGLIHIGYDDAGYQEIQEAQKVFELADSPEEFHESLCWLYEYLGDCGIVSDNIDIGISYYKKGLKIAQHNYPELESRICFCIANVYEEYDFPSCYDYYNHGLELARKTQNQYLQVKFLEQLGKYHWRVGEPRTSLEYYQKAQSIHLLLQTNHRIIANFHGYLARTHIMLNEKDEAYKALMEAEKSLGEYPDPYFEAAVFFFFIEYYLAFNQVENARKYLNKLLSITSDLKDGPDILYQWLMIFEGKVLARSNQFADKARAEELCRKLTEGKILPESRLMAYECMLELKLDQLKLGTDNESLFEFRNLLMIYNDYARETIQYPHVIKAELLLSQLALLESEFNEARTILEKAMDYCGQQHLVTLGKRIKQELDKLDKEQILWVNYLNSNPTLVSKLEKSNLQRYISQAVLWLDETSNEVRNKD